MEGARARGQTARARLRPRLRLRQATQSAHKCTPSFAAREVDVRSAASMKGRAIRRGNTRIHAFLRSTEMNRERGHTQARFVRALPRPKQRHAASHARSVSARAVCCCTRPRNR
eukprot:6193301-Pleurochrysis_carterae.AAC.3